MRSILMHSWMAEKSGQIIRVFLKMSGKDFAQNIRQQKPGFFFTFFVDQYFFSDLIAWEHGDPFGSICPAQASWKKSSHVDPIDFLRNLKSRQIEGNRD
jgi:hypothetical protein